MPIYFVIEEWVPNPLQQGVYRIVKVIECDYEEVNTIWNREVQPLTFGTGRNIGVRYYYREPANPLKLMALQQENAELREKLTEAEAYIENVDTTNTGYGRTYTTGR